MKKSRERERASERERKRGKIYLLIYLLQAEITTGSDQSVESQLIHQFLLNLTRDS